MTESGRSVRCDPASGDSRFRNLRGLPLSFQPIVDVNAKTVFGYEVFLPGTNNEADGEGLLLAAEADPSGHDDADLAPGLNLPLDLDASLMLAVHLSCAASFPLKTDLQIAEAFALAGTSPVSHLMFEVSHQGGPACGLALRALLGELKSEGFKTAIDRFGIQEAGLDLLAESQPDAVKLDALLVHNVNADPVRLAIVAGIAQICGEIGIQVVAVGVNTGDECLALSDAGLHLFQGDLFAPPRREVLPRISSALWPEIERRAATDRRQQQRRSAGRRKSC